MSKSDASKPDWVSATEAARVLGVHAQTIRRRADDMGIRKRLWGTCRYFRPDVERVAREQLAPSS